MSSQNFWNSVPFSICLLRLFVYWKDPPFTTSFHRNPLRYLLTISSFGKEAVLYGTCRTPMYSTESINTYERWVKTIFAQSYNRIPLSFPEAFSSATSRVHCPVQIYSSNWTIFLQQFFIMIFAPNSKCFVELQESYKYQHILHLIVLEFPWYIHFGKYTDFSSWKYYKVRYVWKIYFINDLEK